MEDVRTTIRTILHEHGVDALLCTSAGFGIFLLHPIWVGMVLMMLVAVGILALCIGGFRLVAFIPLIVITVLFPDIVKAVLWVASLVGVIVLLVALGKIMDFASAYRKRVDLALSTDLWFFRNDYRTMMVERTWLKRVLLALMIDLAAVIPLYGFTFLAPNFAYSIQLELIIGFWFFAAMSGFSLLCLAILIARHPDRAARDRPTIMLFGLTSIVFASFGVLLWLGTAEGSMWLQLPSVSHLDWLRSLVSPTTASSVPAWTPRPPDNGWY